jgi:hypothetical protein
LSLEEESNIFSRAAWSPFFFQGGRAGSHQAGLKTDPINDGKANMRLEELKEEVFAQHLNTKFFVPLEERRVELELVKITGDKTSMDKIEGVERFALYFLGPGDFYLPQRVYTLEHEALGTLEIFIVPVGARDKRYEYEAIFSRITNKE